MPLSGCGEAPRRAGGEREVELDQPCTLRAGRSRIDEHSPMLRLAAKNF